jgi:hypothetical protein
MNLIEFNWFAALHNSLHGSINLWDRAGYSDAVINKSTINR